MIAAGPHRSEVHTDAQVQGWLVSVLLHATLAFAVILLVRQIQFAPQHEPFKWNVAMVSPTEAVQLMASPANQAPDSSVPSNPVPFSPVRQIIPAQTLPSLQPLAQQTTPPISERTATPRVRETSAPTPPPPTTPSQLAAPPTPPAEFDRQKTVEATSTDSISGRKPVQEPTAVFAGLRARTAPANVPPASLEQTTQSDTDPSPTQMAAIYPAPSNAPTKRDYGWLSEVILRRVEELKRYPASARVDQAQGKVVVKAVINEDGSIGEVEVFQSSGHPSLDRAAVETMWQAAPFHLPHPLGLPRMTITIPMNYRLDRP